MSFTRKIPPLHDTAPVIRGGEMYPSDLERNALHTARTHGRPGISVWAANDLTASGLMITVAGRVPHVRIRVSTAGALRRAGFELIPCGGPLHYTILLPAGYDLNTLLALAALFDPPVPRDDLPGVGTPPKG